MSHLNYFEPYRSKPAGHEDQLSRAFLVLVRLSPVVRAAFLGLLRERQPEAGYDHLLPRLSEVREDLQFDTQTSHLDPDREWLVSLLMTDNDLPMDNPLDDRGSRAIYDGVVTLGTHVLTIENKPRNEHVWLAQVNPDMPQEGSLSLEEGAKALVLPWKEMIGHLVGLREGDMLTPTEDRLVDDFLGYVEEHFDFLNPYPTFGACGDSLLRLNKRCRQILVRLVGEEHVEEHPQSGFFVKLPGKRVPAERVFLRAKRDEAEDRLFVEASVHPADLIRQARKFYGEGVDHEGIVELADQDRWSVEPNLTLRFQGTPLVKGSADPSLRRYLRYWRQHRDEIGRVEGVEAMREEVERYLDSGFLTSEDRERFEASFVEKRGTSMNPCPGVSLRYRWSLGEAQDLDDGELAFVRELRSRLEPVLDLWGQKLPVRQATS